MRRSRWNMLVALMLGFGLLGAGAFTVGASSIPEGFPLGAAPGSATVIADQQCQDDEGEGVDDADNVEEQNEAEDDDTGASDKAGDDENGVDDADEEGDNDNGEECEDGDAEASAPSGTLDDGKELLPQASITLDQAIAKAQDAASGEIGEVDLEDYNGTLVFNVDVGSSDVKIDAQTGEVLATDQDD